MTGWAAGPSAEQLQAIKRLSPEAVQAYLSGEGWVPRQTAREGLWTLAEGADEFEVLVPYDRQVRDFSLRMYDLLRTLATIQDRPLPMVLADLAGAGADRMTLRLLPAGPPGTIALAHGAEAMQGVHDLVLAAAYASTLERPLPVQQGRRPQSVRDFARRARLRSPQAGSWVISVEIDVDDDLSDDIADELGDDLYRGEEQPSARQVSRALHGGLHASFLAATEALRDDPLEPFLRRVPEGCRRICARPSSGWVAATPRSRCGSRGRGGPRRRRSPLEVSGLRRRCYGLCNRPARSCVPCCRTARWRSPAG